MLAYWKDQIKSIVNTSELPANHKIGETLISSRYRDALHDVFLDLKYKERQQIQAFNIFHMEECNRARDSLEKSLMYSGPQFSSDGKKDEDLINLEENYKNILNQKIEEIKKHDNELNMHAQGTLDNMANVLKKQMKYVPIDERDFDMAKSTIMIRYSHAQNEVRQHLINELILVKTKSAETRKKRRNFGKEALDTLHKYYNTHQDHPYPNDNEKAMLAKKCNITIQQVSNWFGNRRIRDKKISNEDAMSRSSDSDSLYRTDDSDH